MITFNRGVFFGSWSYCCSVLCDLFRIHSILSLHVVWIRGALILILIVKVVLLWVVVFLLLVGSLFLFWGYSLASNWVCFVGSVVIFCFLAFVSFWHIRSCFCLVYVFIATMMLFKGFKGFGWNCSKFCIWLFAWYCTIFFNNNSIWLPLKKNNFKDIH